MEDYNLEKRGYVIAGIAIMIVVIYIICLFILQLLSDGYKKNADSNAFLRKMDYPSRGIITDRHDKLMVYNQPAYDIMVVINRQKNRVDILGFCEALGIIKDFFGARMAKIKDRNKNPGYSRFMQQLFMSQLSDKEFNVFQKKIYRFPGFYIQKQSIRQYQYSYAAHVLGDVAEVSPSDIEDDDYYQVDDYIGKLGVERSYEKQLRGQRGAQISLRDVHGKVQGSYQNGGLDTRPIPGKDLTLSLDLNLQTLGERLLQGKIGNIVAIEPSTGEVLCMVSSPTYDLRWMMGKKRRRIHHALQRDQQKLLLNRSVMGQYPPGSTSKTTQALTYLSEGIIPLSTSFACHRGFYYRGLHVGCHGHVSPLALVPAISTPCSAYFCQGLYYMIGSRRKYKNVQTAMDTWRNYMVSMGFGYELGIDSPDGKRGLVPDSTFYDKTYHDSWNGLTIISISIGQGEVDLTPLQIANLGATIANQDYYHVPHMMRRVQDEPLDTLFARRHYTKTNRRAYDYVVAGVRSAAECGTYRTANRADYAVCGETGTTQNRRHDHSAFMGFTPMNNPKTAIAVYVKNGGFGTGFGMPIGSLMIEQYIKGSLSPTSEAKARTV